MHGSGTSPANDVVRADVVRADAVRGDAVREEHDEGEVLRSKTFRRRGRIEAEASREKSKRVRERKRKAEREAQAALAGTPRVTGGTPGDSDAASDAGPGSGSRARSDARGRGTSKPRRTSPSNTLKASTPHKSKPRDGNAKRRRRRQAQELAKRVEPDELGSEELVRLYYESGAKRLRAAIVERFLADVGDMARMLGARMPRTVDTEDLCNAGYFGLLRSLDSFDPSKGRSFTSYMRQRVYGSMVDELRAMDWLPRLMRSRLAQRAHAVRVLTQELGREPSETEVAAQLGLSLDAYRRAYPASGSVQRTTLFANTELDLEQIENAIVGIGASGRDAHDTSHPLTGLYHQELIERVRELLSETEWRLVDLHYLQGRKLREVAHELGLSPARICQIHHAVMQRLKERLRGEAFTI